MGLDGRGHGAGLVLALASKLVAPRVSKRGLFDPHALVLDSGRLWFTSTVAGVEDGDRGLFHRRIRRDAWKLAL